MSEKENKIQVLTGSIAKPLVPTDIDSMWRMAQGFARSGFLPKSYDATNIEDKTAKAFTAIQLGAELGMLPMQSIQSIAVVNGMPTIWGDAQKGLVYKSGLVENMQEYFEGDFPSDNFKAVIKVKRKGQPEDIQEFSVQDAKNAKLWDKPGVWQTHKKRMMKYKVRSFALRDNFPDVLKGMYSYEEMQGEMIDVTPQDATIRNISDINIKDSDEKSSVNAEDVIFA